MTHDNYDHTEINGWEVAEAPVDVKLRQHQKIIRRPNGSLKVVTVNIEETRTQQQYLEQCDVNYIMKRFNQTGEITHIMQKKGVYMDSTNLPDYQEALQTVITAENAFYALPAEMRKKFDNDPGVMIKYLEDDTNNEEAIKLGLKIPKETPTDTQILNELQTLNKNTSQTKTKSKSPSNPSSKLDE